MKQHLVLSIAALAAASLAHAGPVEEIAAAAKKLDDAPNYAWTLTMEIGNASVPPIPSEGVTEKDGFTVITTTFNGNSRQIVRKGEQVVFPNRDGVWMTMDELRQQSPNGGRGGGFFPGGNSRLDFAKDVANLAGKLKDLKSEEGAIVGTLAAEDAAKLLTFGRPGAGDPPPGKNASGSVKIWLKDGALAKYAVSLRGTVTAPNGEEREIDLTTTTEFKNVGTTKVVVPEEAKKKFGA